MLLTVINILWVLLQCFIGIHVLFPLLSWLWYLLAGKKSKMAVSATPGDYAIIVTAYKDSSNINNVVRSLLTLNHSNFIVYVVADDCEPMNDPIVDDRLVILYPPQPFANQVKSHFYAISQFKRPHNRLTIIDSDNLTDSNYLKELDPYFDAGYEAVQGVRAAKNFDSIYACLDAANELYYLFYDRKILFAIGSSSMLSGSGMAFTVDLFKKCLGDINSSGAGFDKILQKQILMSGKRIAFAEAAVVYDEKTSNADQLVKQRARWNNTWFRYFSFGFQLMLNGLKKFSRNQFLYGFIILRPPLFILLILSFLITGVNIFVSKVMVIVWLIGLLVFVLNFFLALWLSKTDQRIYKALVYIPNFIFLQVLSLLKVRRANQHSVATQHSFNKEIGEIKK